ncbi:hypothetical protein RRG08_027147 [Elysia crispata]|uniref:Uncharacterized protein n=1 Tax=Elysia crispata TaxID=231223 RepID=A0AAE1D584_9GAST|nr:hypothetical protein RRG08_027147 [Elysia crispata]
MNGSTAQNLEDLSHWTQTLSPGLRPSASKPDSTYGGCFRGHRCGQSSYHNNPRWQTAEKDWAISSLSLTCPVARVATTIILDGRHLVNRSPPPSKLLF